MDFNAHRYTAVDELRSVMALIDADQVHRLARGLLEARTVFTAGAGRSGLAMRGFAMRLMHLGVAVNVVGDVTATAFGKGDLLVVGSGSGATPALLPLCGKARNLEGSVALLTTDPDSPLARTAQMLVLIPATTPKAVSGETRGSPTSLQPMASLFEQSLWILLDSLIALLMRERGITGKRMFVRHANLE